MALTAIEDRLQLAGDEGAVFFHARLATDFEGMARAHHLEILGAVEDQLDRSARLERQHHDEIDRNVEGQIQEMLGHARRRDIDHPIAQIQRSGDRKPQQYGLDKPQKEQGFRNIVPKKPKHVH